jgi:hypothetical protein
MLAMNTMTPVSQVQSTVIAKIVHGEAEGCSAETPPPLPQSFMEPEISTPCSQQHVTQTYPETVKSSPHPPIHSN